jgi:hypothetical protein
VGADASGRTRTRFLSVITVTDVTIQSRCPRDPVTHMGMFEGLVGCSGLRIASFEVATDRLDARPFRVAAPAGDQLFVHRQQFSSSFPRRQPRTANDRRVYPLALAATSW